MIKTWESRNNERDNSQAFFAPTDMQAEIAELREMLAIKKDMEQLLIDRANKATAELDKLKAERDKLEADNASLVRTQQSDLLAFLAMRDERDGLAEQLDIQAGSIEAVQAANQRLVVELGSLKQQEPVAWFKYDQSMECWRQIKDQFKHLVGGDAKPLYAAPVGYVPLSEWKLKELWETECPDEHFCSQHFDFAKAIERAVRGIK